MAGKKPSKQWVRGVKTVSTFPPKDLFTKDAQTIARRMASQKVSPKGRRAGVKLPATKKGKTSARTRRSAELASKAGQSGHAHKTNPRGSRAITAALKREGKGAASHEALARQAKQQAHKRTATERS